MWTFEDSGSGWSCLFAPSIVLTRAAPDICRLLRSVAWSFVTIWLVFLSNMTDSCLLDVTFYFQFFLFWENSNCDFLVGVRDALTYVTQLAWSYSTVWIILQTSPLFDCVASYLFHMDFSSTEMCFNVSFSRDTWHDNRTVFFGVLAYYLFWKCKCVTSLIANKLTTTILIFLLSCNKVLQRTALAYLWRHKQTLAFKYSRLYSDFIPMTSQQLFIFTSSLLQILHPQPLPWLQFALNQASGWVAWHRTRRVDREIILEVGELSTRINIGFTRSWQLLLTSGS